MKTKHTHTPRRSSTASASSGNCSASPASTGGAGPARVGQPPQTSMPCLQFLDARPHRGQIPCLGRLILRTGVDVMPGRFVCVRDTLPNLPRTTPVPSVRCKYMTADCIRNNVSSCIRCQCSGSEIKLSKTTCNTTT